MYHYLNLLTLKFPDKPEIYAVAQDLWSRFPFAAVAPPPRPALFSRFQLFTVGF